MLYTLQKRNNHYSNIFLCSFRNLANGKKLNIRGRVIMAPWKWVCKNKNKIHLFKKITFYSKVSLNTEILKTEKKLTNIYANQLCSAWDHRSNTHFSQFYYRYFCQYGIFFYCTSTYILIISTLIYSLVCIRNEIKSVTDHWAHISLSAGQIEN
jgi:hypothetical protein